MDEGNRAGRDEVRRAKIDGRRRAEIEGGEEEKDGRRVRERHCIDICIRSRSRM